MVYYVFTVNKRLTTKQLLSATLIIFSSIIYTSYETDTEKASRLIGKMQSQIKKINLHNVLLFKGCFAA